MVRLYFGSLYIQYIQWLLLHTILIFCKVYYLSGHFLHVLCVDHAAKAMWGRAMYRMSPECTLFSYHFLGKNYCIVRLKRIGVCAFCENALDLSVFSS